MGSGLVPPIVYLPCPALSWVVWGHRSVDPPPSLGHLCPLSPLGAGQEGVLETQGRSHTLVTLPLSFSFPGFGGFLQLCLGPLPQEAWLPWCLLLSSLVGNWPIPPVSSEPSGPSHSPEKQGSGAWQGSGSHHLSPRPPQPSQLCRASLHCPSLRGCS